MLRYRRPADGRPAKLTLGAVYLGDDAPDPALGGPLTLAGARKVALEQRSLVDLGRDPGAEKRDARTARRVALAETFGDLLREYHDRHASKKNRAAATSRDILLKECADWLARPARMVSRRDMRDLLDGIVDRGSPVMANRVRSYLSAVFAWGIEREMVDGNPAREVARPAHEEARDRVLDDRELAEVWRAADTLGDPWAPLAKILILTGQRLGEVEAMRWTDLRDIDGDEPVWHIPAEVTKNKLPHDVPLPPEVAAILRDLRVARRSTVDEIEDPARRRLVESVPFVFWGGRVGRRGSVTKLSGRSRFRERWRAAVDAARAKEDRDGMPDWRPHDLRRTAVSGMGPDRRPDPRGRDRREPPARAVAQGRGPGLQPLRLCA